MTQTTENRIWRGLFLIAIAGVGLAATSGQDEPKAVALSSVKTGTGAAFHYMLMEDGTLYSRPPLADAGWQLVVENK